MSTGRQILTRAFSKAGVKVSEAPLTASEIEDGLDLLNDLLSTWDATGTLKGVPPIAEVDDIVKAPRHALWALKANVAILLAGEYGIQVSQAMANDATSSMREMVKASIDLSNVEYPDSLPSGSGNINTDYADEDFFPSNTKINF